MRNRKAILLISAALLTNALLTFVSTQAAGQSGRRLPSTTQQDRDGTVRLRAEEVLLNVTVVDEYGRQVTSLRKDEFIVAEDGKRQDIVSFAVATVPVNVVLLLDASGSIAGEISSLRNAAASFVEHLTAQDKICAIEFHTKVELIQDWTTNRDDLLHAISWRFKPGVVRDKRGRAMPGTTSLYDALYLAAREQLEKVDGRKAIILLTDGLDTTSKITYDEALAAVRRADAVVYVVSKARAFIAGLEPYRSGVGRVLAGGNARQAEMIIAQLERAEELMTQLAAQTGGRIFSPMEEKEMAGVYGQVARELKNQYVITYTPKNKDRDGKLRRIGVYLTRPGYAARTRDGYYAPTG